MVLTKKKIFFLILVLISSGITNTHAQDLNISGDTIYVNAEAEIMVRFPSLPSSFYTVPANAPYNFKTAGTGFTISAKAERTSPAPLFVTEGNRNHRFIIVFKKKINYNDDAEMDYDFSTTKKIEQHIRNNASIKLIEEKEDSPVKKDKKSKKDKPGENTVANYYALLEQGDQEMKQKNYGAAKLNFEKAAKLRPDDLIPKQRLEEIKLRTADQEKAANQEINKQYVDVIATAKSSLHAKKYTKAQESFKKALELKPGDIYARHQLDKIDELLKAETAKQDQQKLDGLYKGYITTGEKALKKNDLVDARVAFEQALIIKQNDAVALNKLKTIGEKEKAERVKAEAESNYTNTIENADKLFKAGDYDEAKAEYTKALGMGKKAWPEDQIRKINKIQADVLVKKKADDQKQADVKQNEMLESNYNAAIKDGDKYFAAKDYTKATAAYNKALNIHKRSWPNDQIKAIEKLINEEAAEKRKIAAQSESDKQAKERKKKEEKEYKDAIKEADKLFKSKDYLAAKALYLKATALNNEKWPRDQVIAIDKIVEEQVAKENAEKIKLAREAEVNTQYNALIDKAKKEFNKANYILARKLYTDASKVKPAEDLPKEKISLIQSTLDQIVIAEKAKKDSIATAAEIKKNYLLAMSKGKSYILKDDLANAKLAYAEASGLKPGEAEPKDQIKAIQLKLDELAKKNDVNDLYEQKLATADSLLVLKSYESAITFYNAALKIKPGEYYPQKQITYSNAEIKNEQKNKEELARLEAYRKEEEVDRKYRDALKRGKDAVAEQKYDVAKAAYTEILTLRPGNEYAQHMISVVNYQMEKAKKETTKKTVEPVPVTTEKATKEVPKEAKTPVKSELITAASIPYTPDELKAKYPNIDFENLPPEQPFNEGAVNTSEKLPIFNEILSEAPRLNISTVERKITMTCQAINFESDNVYLKLLIKNSSSNDFLTGAMMLTWIKKSGNKIKLYPVYLYPAFLPIVPPGKEAVVIYVCKSYYIADQEKLTFELNDRFNKIKLDINIPGSKYNTEEERYYK